VREAAAKMWAAHAKAREAADDLAGQATQLSADLARMASLIDTLRDQSRLAHSRAMEIGSSLGRLADAFERLRLLALNVGLDGARLGEPSARILGAVAEEVRAQAEQGGVAVADLRSLIDEIVPEWASVNTSVERIRQTDAEVRSRAGATQETAQRVGGLLDEVGTWARQLSDSDPETAKILAQATEHARGLVSSLSALGDRARREVVAAAIGPTLRPLLGLLRDPRRGASPDK
jgi:methyl-accepting chemotaxis protein